MSAAQASQVETPLADAEARHACANCATPLVGKYCHECGQKGHLHDKLSHLMHEMLEGVAHFDGRLWRTLPLLAFNPGRLSREWMDGKRMRYVAPLHVFLFAIFLVFLIPNFTGDRLLVMDASDAAKIEVQTDRPQAGKPATGLEARVEGLADSMKGKSKDAKYYSYKMEMLAYKLAFLLAPIGMTILALVTWRPSRRSTAYKHGVVALYGLGAAAMGLCLVMITPKVVEPVVALILVVGLPLHAIAHLRGAYGCSWTGAVLRSVVLGVLTLASFGLFLVGVALLGLFG